MITRPITVLLPVHKQINYLKFKKSMNSVIYKQTIIPKEFIVLIDGPVDPRIFDYLRILKRIIK